MKLTLNQFKLVLREDGWWFLTPWPDSPEHGPYETRAEAKEALESMLRNWIGNFTPSEVCTGRSGK